MFTLISWIKNIKCIGRQQRSLTIMFVMTFYKSDLKIQFVVVCGLCFLSLRFVEIWTILSICAYISFLSLILDVKRNALEITLLQKQFLLTFSTFCHIKMFLSRKLDQNRGQIWPLLSLLLCCVHFLSVTCNVKLFNFSV